MVPGATVVLSVSVTNTATLPIGYRLRRNNVTLPATPANFLTLNERTAYFTLSGTNTMPPWTNYAIVVTNAALSSGNISASAILTYVTDSDGDRMPDDWELAYGLDRLDPADASLDADADGLTNLQEFQAGTNPRDSQSVLRLDAIEFAAGTGEPLLSFRAASNRTYSLFWKESLNAGEWAKLADVPARATEQVAQVVDPMPLARGRLYRVVTPRQPGEVNPMPAILASPTPTVTDLGGDATLSVIAIGNGSLRYQWARDSQDIPGTTANSLEVTNVQLTDLGLYSVRVSDQNASKTSSPVYLAVPPRILSQPESQSVPVGDPVTLAVVASGWEPLSYLWFAGDRVLADQTNATLGITNVQVTDAGRYSVYVSHLLPWGEFGVASSNAVLRVEPR